MNFNWNRPIDQWCRLILVMGLSASPSVALIDENGNGYSDVWEHKYNAVDIAPFLDQDGDGEINLAEAHAGTDPFDGQSVFTRADLRDLFYGQLVIDWQSVLGVNYLLEVSETLGPSGWLASQNPFIGDGEVLQARLSMDSQQAFCRLVADPVGSQLSKSYASQISSDVDGDGASDFDEWVLGTDIFNQESRMKPPTIKALDGVGIRWDSQEGKNYQIEGRGIGAGQVWETIGPARPGTGAMMEAVLPFSGESATAYSVGVQDVDRDGDGVTDWEEGVLGLRPDLTHTDHLGDGDYQEALKLLNAPNRLVFAAPTAICNVTRGLDGSLEISRESGIGRLEIELLVSGDATAGTDYEPLPLSVVIPFAQKSVTVPIRPLSGASVSVSEAVTVTLKESALYEVEGEALQTVHLLTENSINVRDYGAVGDGVTDDRAAIQNAINALENDPSQNTLSFPDGQYRLDSYLVDSKTHTSQNRILRLGATELAGRDLIFSFGENARLISTVSPVRAHILECDAKFRSLSFYGAQIEKDDVVLEAPWKAEPNGADGVSLVLHDLRTVKMVQFLGCRFYNCHGAISTYGAGFETRGKLEYFRVQNCHLLNPWGANTVADSRLFGGGQVVNILPWVGTAEYLGNYFDGGSKVESNLAANPLDRKKDGSHFGSPLRLIFKENVVDHMRVEAVYQLHNPLMGFTSEAFEFPSIGGEVTFQLRDSLSIYRAGDLIAIRGSLPGMGTTSVSFTIVDHDPELGLTVRNDGDNEFPLDGLAFTAVKAIYLQGDHAGEAVIIDNVVRALNSDGRRSASGIAATARATIRGNYVEGYAVGVLIYGNSRTPLTPPSRGTLIENNVIYTAEGMADGSATYGIQSFGTDEMIRENLILTPVSTKVIGIALRGENTIARQNTVIAEKMLSHGYSSSSRAVGIGVGNTASFVRIEENTTRGFEVGVGPANPSQSIPHYAAGNLSVDDFLAQDVRGWIEE